MRIAWALVALVALAGCDAALAPVDAGVAIDAGAPADAGPGVDAGGPPEDLDGFVEWQMDHGGIPGAALAIVTADGVEHFTYGYAEIEADRAVDAHTLFIMASVSKLFAAVRAMQLAESGELDLDAPIGDALGYPVTHPEHPGRPVTARMLATHTSGLVDDFATLASALYEGDPTMSLDEFTRAYAVPGGALYEASVWGPPPGTERSYCNAGFGVLGAVLEGAGGESLRQQSEAALFEPLALDGAGWHLADVDASRLAMPYGYNGRSYRPLGHSGVAFYPATSLRISITGLSRFMQMILRRGELDGARVLSEESVDALLTIQDPAVSGRQAFGFSEAAFAGTLFIGHSGSTDGGSTQFLIARDGSYGLIVITNSDAYFRARVPSLRQGAEAIDAIIGRLNELALER